MDDRVLLKVYYFSQILLQTFEGVKFICENPLDIVIPFTISFEELKGVICEKIDSEMSRKISCILYRYPIPIFGGFVQFQTKYVTDEASMQEMFSMYIESCAQISFIGLYIKFEQSEVDRNIEWEDNNSDSEEELESNYKVVGPDRNEDQGDDTMAPNVTDVANVLTNEHPFEEPYFMRVLNLEAIHALEFSEYMNAVVVLVEIPIIADGEFAVGLKFSSKEAVIMATKDHTIRRGVDYRVYESEPLTFYAKCTQVSMISRKYCWIIRRYNGSHTCTRATISQDHSKLDSNTIAKDIRKCFASTNCITNFMTLKLHANQLASENIQVNCFDRQNVVFEVREMPSVMEYDVDLRRQRCDCGEFQVDRISCRHVFACCANQPLDWQVYVHDVYKMDQVLRRVYRARFRPLGNPTTWPAYNGP
ncbi:hypothetical protein Ahy_B01g056703 [Arachis hypogaea]|uniref:SWIM-type domain-containing protein n=1 Tax=Arachis hypogaea TaxID=3818 RepID=A0A445AZC0_ARAHY|nr:hypothetical protein Ahy_B01g056703 [Arachis hypogaea]